MDTNKRKRSYDVYIGTRRGYVIEALGLNGIFDDLVDFYEEQCTKGEMIAKILNEYYMDLFTAFNKMRGERNEAK